jgi:hypothetical protein
MAVVSAIGATGILAALGLLRAYRRACKENP